MQTIEQHERILRDHLVCIDGTHLGIVELPPFVLLVAAESSIVASLQGSKVIHDSIKTVFSLRTAPQSSPLVFPSPVLLKSVLSYHLTEFELKRKLDFAIQLLPVCESLEAKYQDFVCLEYFHRFSCLSRVFATTAPPSIVAFEQVWLLELFDGLFQGGDRPFLPVQR